MPSRMTVDENGQLVPVEGGGGFDLPSVDLFGFNLQLYHLAIITTITFFMFDVEGVVILLIAFGAYSAFMRARGNKTGWNGDNMRNVNDLESMQVDEQRRQDARDGFLTAVAAAAVLSSNRRRG